MKTLITPAEAIALAFCDGEYIAPEHIAVSDIAAAEERWIVPMIGHALHLRLLEGNYAPFVADYLATPLALGVRLAVQPSMDIRTGAYGTVVPRSSSYAPAEQASLRRQQQMLRTKLHTLLRRASRHLGANHRTMPEYDPEHDVLNRCSTEGGIVLLR